MSGMVKNKSPDAVLVALRSSGLAYPGAHIKSPWPGHGDLAVNDKTFAYLSLEGDPFSISCKLPFSSEVALVLPYTKPTAYGLGRSGWVTASFSEGHEPDVEMLEAWIDESYRAQAPKKLIKLLDAQRASPTDAAPVVKRAAKKKTAKKPSASTRTTAKKKPAGSGSAKQSKSRA
jgi:hypothetical protein